MNARIFTMLWQWLRRTVRDFFDNNCPMHAAGLTYFTLLAIIPVLCCILVAAKVCGVDRFARQQLNQRIDAMISNVENGQNDPLASWTNTGSEEEREKKRIAAEEFAAQSRRISNELFERIEQFDVGTLGWIGFGVLLWTIISSLGMAETSFNQIWHVAKPRSIWRRAWTYLFIMVLLPVMITVAMSLPILGAVKDFISAVFGVTAVTKRMGDGLVWFLDLKLFRFLLTWAAASLSFGFFYWVMPNCRVSFRRAWWGGVAVALVFYAWLRICAIAQVGIARSSALYGSFAVLPIVLAWTYMSWQIILIGACAIHAFDHEGGPRHG